MIIMTKKKEYILNSIKDINKELAILYERSLECSKLAKSLCDKKNEKSILHTVLANAKL